MPNHAREVTAMKKKIAFLMLMAFLGTGVGAVLVEPIQAAVTNADYSGTPTVLQKTLTSQGSTANLLPPGGTITFVFRNSSRRR